ncbi:macrophage mannose receptor 1-like [Electrophorus electricus]|uniref:macrophage mannose receptor 1-like n=1 Tax=Electrophorus electricus TaxID=8005 RepID=UPI0015D09844|nr:macrophage mannose receptor 1-like [Electrophorus electricus]
MAKAELCHHPTGWLRFQNKCFLFRGRVGHHEPHANWTYARDWCREQGGHLAVIDDVNENDFVASYLRDIAHHVWIGLSDRLHEGKFAWTDGTSPVLFTNWAEKEPNNNDGQEHCVSMTHNHLVTGLWNDENCGEKRGWVCYTKKSSSIPAPPPTTSPCPSGYISWYRSCYKLVSEARTWEEAQSECLKEGSNLASVDMSYEQAFISGAVQQASRDTWIGLRRTDDGTYKWSDGWPVFYTHWGPGEPTHHKGEGCVSMHGRSFFIQGTWNDTDCTARKPYLCKVTFEKPPPTPRPGDGTCLPGWWPYGSHCYMVYNGKEGFSWHEARYRCQLIRGGDLASVHSRAEAEFIRNINYTKYHNVWLGLTRDGFYGWGWTDMTALSFTNWAPGEPNEAIHDMGREDCVEMYVDGAWNDNNCLQKRGFVCRLFQEGHGGGNTTKPPTTIDAHAGTIAGIVIGTILAVAIVLCALYYMFVVKGVKFRAAGLPRSDTKEHVTVPAFNNPNFTGESDT